MVKRRKKNTKKKRNGKGFKENGAEIGKINASMADETFELWLKKCTVVSDI